MASEWQCRILGQELGPLSFGELAELVRSGTLGAEDPVRRMGQQAWQPAGTVIGLFRAARLAEEQAVAEAPLPAEPEEPEPMSTIPQPRPGAPGHVLPWAVGLGALIFVCGLGYWWHTARMAQRFPEPRALREQIPEGYDFFGTGPWSGLEAALLWFDLVLIVGFLLLCVWKSLGRFRGTTRRYDSRPSAT